MIKEAIVGSVVGRMALAVRSGVELMRAVTFEPEAAGTLLNDQCAGKLVSRLARSGSTFIDVGAHIGSVIAAVLSHDATISVIAIEAVPEKAEALRRRFPGVLLHACAVGDAQGEVSFFVDDAQPGYSSLGQRNDEDARRTRRITVPMQMLDSIITADNVDVVKIDVEGAELGVLNGARQLVARCEPLILFESAPIEHEGLGFTKEALWEWFHERGYDIVVPNRLAHDGPGLSLDGFLESHFYPRRTTNYFGVPSTRRTEFRDRARKLLHIAA